MSTTPAVSRRARAHSRPRRDPWRHLSYGAIARGTGLHTSAISRIFRRQRRPTIPSALKIAGFLGVSVDRLLGELRVRE